MAVILASFSAGSGLSCTEGEKAVDSSHETKDVRAGDGRPRIAASPGYSTPELDPSDLDTVTGAGERTLAWHQANERRLLARKVDRIISKLSRNCLGILIPAPEIKDAARVPIERIIASSTRLRLNQGERENEFIEQNRAWRGLLVSVRQVVEPHAVSEGCKNFLIHLE
jgi:hypothetical protein